MINAVRLSIHAESRSLEIFLNEAEIKKLCAVITRS